MRQDNAQTDKRIEIDPAKFTGQVPRDTDTGERIFSEGAVLKFLIDQLNAAGVDIAMLHADHELAIEYRGRRDYFGMGISSLDVPDVAVIDGMTELTAMINDHTGIESWVSYKDGKHHVHIRESKAEDEAEKPEDEAEKPEASV